MNKKHILVGAATIGTISLAALVAQPETVEEAAQSALTTNPETPEKSEVTESKTTQQDAFNLAVADITVDTTSGSTVTLSELAKEKPTIVGFWASWCHNCQRNLPQQQTLFEKYKDQVNILEVNLSEDRSTVDNYVADKGFDFLIGYDETGINGKQYNIRYTNTHLLIGSDGSLVQGFSGDVNEEHFLKLIEHQKNLIN